jgi:hypothetical protein
MGTNNKKGKENKQTGNKMNIFILVSSIIILLSPIAFTRPAFCDLLDFSKHGEIGEVIGGITAPFIGLLSIYLLWSTLHEQIKFNRKQLSLSAEEQFKSIFFTLLQQYRDIRSETRGTFCQNSEKSEVSGCKFFEEALFQLRRIFNSLNNGNNLIGDGVVEPAIEQQIDEEQSEYHKMLDLPDGLQDDEKIDKSNSFIETGKETLELIRINELYNISKEEFDNYEQKEDERTKTAIGYRLLYNKHTQIKNCFGHLIQILRFMKSSEDYNISLLGDAETEHQHYLQYIQFIITQVSNEELILLFYHCQLPDTDKEWHTLINHFDLLKNSLSVKDLIDKTHCEGSKIELKDDK